MYPNSERIIMFEGKGEWLIQSLSFSPFQENAGAESEPLDSDEK